MRYIYGGSTGARISVHIYTAVTFIVLLLLLTLPTQLRGQIHRAQESKKWQRWKTLQKQLEFSDLDNVNEFDVLAKETRESEYIINESDYEKSETYSGQMVWMYSILSAVVVSLCGIFPLIIIPLETGAALRHGKDLSRLKMLLSFAVGSLLGDVFIHLLPEAWSHSQETREQLQVGQWVLAGILFFFIMEKFFGNSAPSAEICSEKGSPDEADDINDESSFNKFSNESELLSGNLNTYYDGISQTNDTIRRRLGSNKNCDKWEGGDCGKQQNLADHNSDSLYNNNIDEPKSNAYRTVLHESCTSQDHPIEVLHESSTSQDHPIEITGYLNLFANCIDNFTHGLAIGGSYAINAKMGLLTTFAILIHEIPHEISDFAILLRSGFDRVQAAKAQLMTACGGMVGVVFALGSESAVTAGNRTAWILPFTSGGFLYISLVTVTPDLLAETCFRESLKQIVGVCLGVAAMLFVTVVIG